MLLLPSAMLGTVESWANSFCSKIPVKVHIYDAYDVHNKHSAIFSVATKLKKIMH
jgi:hypothetical protein